MWKTTTQTVLVGPFEKVGIVWRTLKTSEMGTVSHCVVIGRGEGTEVTLWEGELDEVIAELQEKRFPEPPA